MDAPRFAIVVGGGFFGCTIAAHLQRHYGRVILIERESNLLQRASFSNQARVHHGYHYPRSLMTALRSKESYSRFTRNYADCLDQSFRHYYAVSNSFSKVNATYFEQFVRRIGAPISAMQPSESSLFSTETVEEAFLVEEAAFDAAKLRNRVRSDLNTANVEVLTGVVAQHVCRERGRVTVTCQSADDKFELEAGHVFNCAFSGINRLLRSSGLDPLPMKFELAELALVEPPAELRDVGITVMCGPFFSCMPFPALGLHSLSHVRYTPHFAWTNDTIEDALEQETWRLKPPETHFPLMVRDAARFVPALARCRYRNSLWEVKAILQNSESNDSRPILFARDVGMPGLHCVLGAKIDNVYDILDEIDRYLQASRMAA